MASALDMSLDDLIKRSKSTKSSSGGGDGGRSGPIRRLQNRPASSASLSNPYPPTGKALGDSVTCSLYGVYSDHVAAAAAAAPPPVVSLETGTKLYISNLHDGVTNEDIHELFSGVGELKRYSINYDRTGRSKGTAEVVYTSKRDALDAIKRYNNVQLDGKPMKIELIASTVSPFSYDMTFANPNGIPNSGPGRGSCPIGMLRGGRGSGGHGQGRTRGHDRGRSEQKSAADLDAELDQYRAEARKKK